MRAVCALVAAAGLSVAASGAWAQTELAVSPALQCLTHGETPLAYPPEMLERKDGGMVRVELTFQRADRAPSVKLLNETVVLSELERAVRRHVDQFRVPCLKDGDPPVVLRQDDVFAPNDGRKVVSSTPRDEGDAERRRQLACLKHVKSEQRPEYPRASLRLEEQGIVVARLRFTAPDAPPVIEVPAASKPKALRASMERFAEGLRLPCLTGGPLETINDFRFIIDGGERRLLKDLTLMQLLGAAKDVPTGVYFDLAAMACPFDLRLTDYRPYQANTINELDTAVPERRAFLDWLSQITLKLKEPGATDVLGQTINLHVPCTKIDL